MYTRFHYLLEGYLSASLNPVERQEFLALVSQNEQTVSQLVEECLASGQFAGGGDKAMEEHIYSQIRKGMKDAPVRRVPFLRRHFIRYAAAAVLLIVCSLWFVVERNKRRQPSPVVQTNPRVPIDIQPGHDGAVLTLADGKQIVLDSAGNGNIAQQQGSAIVKQGNQLVYNATGAPDSPPPFNTITTPKGRQFQLVLPDGSNVWLNAASSISYPTAFVGNERKVRITGEACFEVVKDKAKPFKVYFSSPIGGGREGAVEVLGTHFNINAYDDEEVIKTTLLEGSVRLTQNAVPKAFGSGMPATESIMLKPGEQGLLTANHKLQTTNNINLAQVVAWKNGLFNFENTSLKDVMRQVARWYNVEVEFQGKVPDTRFGGEMGRDLPLADLLEFLEKSDVHFRIEPDHKLVVLP